MTARRSRRLALAVLALLAMALVGGFLPRRQKTAVPSEMLPGEAPTESRRERAPDGGRNSSMCLGQWESASALEVEAGDILRRYQSEGNCLLVRSGYLDLLGRTWSCVVQGDGWIDLCMVQSTDGGGCQVKVSRMDPSAWEEELYESGAIL